MKNSRRSSLQNLQFDDLIKKEKHPHPGLWLDKYLEGWPENDRDEPGKKAKQKLIEEACEAGIPVEYKDAYKSRFGEGKRPHNTLCAKVEVDNCRLIIGLGQKGVLEAGITLDHTWGVPYIPGSALKGIAAWAALESDESKNKEWNERLPIKDEKEPNKEKKGRGIGKCYLALFGGPDANEENDEKGCVIFHDAWWIPPDKDNPNQKLPIHLDVMTVHHSDYYTAKDNPPAPSDMDSPVPIPFVSVTGTFMIMLEGPKEWCDAAMKLLEYGLKNHGIGAKTAGGYGRMELKRL